TPTPPSSSPPALPASSETSWRLSGGACRPDSPRFREPAPRRTQSFANLCLQTPAPHELFAAHQTISPSTSTPARFAAGSHPSPAPSPATALALPPPTSGLPATLVAICATNCLGPTSSAGTFRSAVRAPWQSAPTTTPAPRSVPAPQSAPLLLITRPGRVLLPADPALASDRLPIAHNALAAGFLPYTETASPRFAMHATPQASRSSLRVPAVLSLPPAVPTPGTLQQGCPAPLGAPVAATSVHVLSTPFRQISPPLARRPRAIRFPSCQNSPKASAALGPFRRTTSSSTPPAPACPSAPPVAETAFFPASSFPATPDPGPPLASPRPLTGIAVSLRA